MLCDLTSASYSAPQWSGTLQQRQEIALILFRTNSKRCIALEYLMSYNRRESYQERQHFLGHTDCSDVLVALNIWRRMYIKCHCNTKESSATYQVFSVTKEIRRSPGGCALFYLFYLGYFSETCMFFKILFIFVHSACLFKFSLTT